MRKHNRERGWKSMGVEVMRGTTDKLQTEAPPASSPTAVQSFPSQDERKPENRRIGVCIIVENNPVPFDRRVWQEARALAGAGYQVSVICPKGLGFTESRETLEGIEIYRHRAWEASGRLGYFIEYPWALVCEFLLALRVYADTRFRILQACNPPDTIFLIALFFKLFGVRFVFDHHDLNPELYEARFRRKDLFYRLACWAERLTFRTADVILCANESFREIAFARGRVLPQRSFVVRSCPDLSAFRPQPAQPELKQGRKYLVVYVGVMGPQDGLGLLLESIHYLVKAQNRSDTLFVLIGPGSELPKLRAIATERDLDPVVRFTGPIYGKGVHDYLATADVGVVPDPSSVFNDKLTMIKTLEYMAYAVPVVLYDLTEGRRTAADAALYAKGNDPIDFAGQIARLLDSEALRRQLGECGRRRVEQHLNWDVERQELLSAYKAVLQSDHAS